MLLVFFAVLFLQLTSLASAIQQVDDPSIVAYTCPFELNICGFSIEADKTKTSYSWKTRKGFAGNPWTKTGPMVDHTFLTSEGIFAYTDSTQGTIGSKTKMTSPIMSCSGDQCCLEFYYHMFGQGMGTLGVYITHPVFGDIELATLGGESLGSKWRRFRRTISPLGITFQFFLEATRSYAPSIIAIDDVSVFQEGCPTDDEVRTLPYSCDFSTDMCGMYSEPSDGELSWSFQNGTTLSSTSGPTYDPYGGTSFVYVESAARSRQRAVLWTPMLNATYLTTFHCIEVSFDYYMYGTSMGSLSLRMAAGFNSTLLFQRSGSASDEWLGGYARAYASVIPATAKTIQFYFEAENVTSPSSNVAITGLRIRPIICSNTTCSTETKWREAMVSSENTMSFMLLPGSTSQDCLDSCMTSSDCLAVTYDWARSNNCTHFLNTSDAIVTGVPSALTVVKTCIGLSTCSVLLYGQYRIDGTYNYDFKPKGTPATSLVGENTAISDRACQIACSSRSDCVAVSYFFPYNGTCEIYTAAGTTITNEVVEWEPVALRRAGYPVDCPSIGTGQCGFPHRLPEMSYPAFVSLSEGAMATYVCEDSNGAFINGNGISTCQSDLTWSGPGHCEFQGLCNVGRSMFGLNSSPRGIGSLTYVFSSEKFTCEGVLARWQIFVKNPDVPVYLDIWAPDTTRKFTLVGYHKFIPKVPGLQYFTPDEQIRIFPGFTFGFHYESDKIPAEALVIPFADFLSPTPWTDSDLMDTVTSFFKHSDLKIGSSYEFQSVLAKSRIPALRAFVVIPKDCEGHPTTPGGQVVTLTEGNTVGSVATFKCRGNYIMTGSPQSKCLIEGKWSTPPACNHPGYTSGCGDPPPVLSAVPVYTSTAVGSEVTYSCSEGFRGGVVASATCQQDQTWGPDIPTCNVAENCAIGPTIVDSSSLNHPGSLWLAILNSNFTCSGRLRRWTYWSQQSGVPVYFGVFAKTDAGANKVAFTLVNFTKVITQSTNSLESYDIPDSTTFIVAKGQYIGIFYDRPLDDGSRGAIPRGSATSTGVYSASDLVEAWLFPYGHSKVTEGGTIEFTPSILKVIYPLRASVTVPPTKCSPPLPVPNAEILYNQVDIGATATYKCLNKYIMIGEPVITCHSLGYWTQAVPVCEAPDSCSVGVEGQQTGAVKLDTYLRIFSEMIFSCSGELRRWKFTALVAGIKVYLGVWRKDGEVGNRWKLIGFNEFTAATAGQVTYDVPLAQRILVATGDVLGIHYDSPFFGSNMSVIETFASEGSKGYEEKLGNEDIIDDVVIFEQEKSPFYIPSIYASITISAGCSVAPRPLNGLVSQPNSTHAVYTCEEGYKMIGEATVDCSMAGVWPSPPACVGDGGCVAGLSGIGDTSRPFATTSTLLHVFTTLTFSCSGKVIGWAFISTTEDHVVYLSAWRRVSGRNYTLVGFNKVWATQVGYNYATIDSDDQFNVDKNDIIGIFYQSANMPAELLVIPYAGQLDVTMGLVSQLDSGYDAVLGKKQLSVGSSVNLGPNMKFRWRTPQVQAIVKS